MNSTTHTVDSKVQTKTLGDVNLDKVLDIAETVGELKLPSDMSRDLVFKAAVQAALYPGEPLSL